MYFLILSKNSGLRGLFHHVLFHKNCVCKTARTLTALSAEIRLKVPDCIIFDSDFFSFANKNVGIEGYIRGTNFFDKFDFPIFLYDKRNFKKLGSPIFQSDFCNSKVKNNTEHLLKNAAQKLESLKKIPEELRPAEKKLYNLLKCRAEESLSLEEMSFALWGVHTNAHRKTLYTYIHRINNILERIGTRPETLKKAKKGCYKLTFESL